MKINGRDIELVISTRSESIYESFKSRQQLEQARQADLWQHYYFQERVVDKPGEDVEIICKDEKQGDSDI